MGFYPENVAFRFCNTVDFREIEGKNELLIAIDPLFWFRYLKEEGCRMLGLDYHPAEEWPPAKEHQLAGPVGGGGIWLIEAIFADYSDFWVNRWQVTWKDDLDRRIWCVNYGRTEVKKPTLDQKVDLATATDELRAALGAIIVFSRGVGLKSWAEFFQKVAERVIADGPAEGITMRHWSHLRIMASRHKGLCSRPGRSGHSTAWVPGMTHILRSRTRIGTLIQSPRGFMRPLIRRSWRQ